MVCFRTLVCASTHDRCVPTTPIRFSKCHLRPAAALTHGFFDPDLRTHFGKADALRLSGGAVRVRRLASVSVIIIGLGVMVALPLVVLELVAPRVHPLDRVVSVTDPSEQHHAYTCIAGALSTCFEPFDQDPDMVPKP